MLQEKCGRVSGGWVSLGLSRWHLPSQMFHCVSPTPPPEGRAVNSGIPRAAPPSIWKDLMMNNKATGLHIYHFLHELSALLPRIQFGWDLKQTAVKAAGSGHAFRPPGLEGFSEQTDWLSLSDPSGVRQGRRCCAAILGSGFQQERRKWWWWRKWNKEESVMTAKTRMFVIILKETQDQNQNSQHFQVV